MGKAGFCHMQQGGRRLQIYVKKDAVGDAGFDLYKLLDLGDHIGVSGYLFRTRTGELTIHVEQIAFLSKDLLPAAGKISWAYRRRAALPPALRRSGDESRGARSLPEAQPTGAVAAAHARMGVAFSKWKRP